MDNEKININVSPENDELIIRHGEALPQRPPRQEVLECTLPGVYEWIEKREDLHDLHPANSLITFDVHEGKIHYTEQVRIPETHMVTGAITPSPDLEAFRINSGKYETPEDLADRLRALSHCFATRSELLDLVSKLKNFEANVSQQIHAKSDDRGNAKRLRNQAVQSNLPEEFTILLPFIKGAEKSSLKVQVFASEDLKVTLFSYDYNEEMNELKDRLVREEIDRLKTDFPEIPIIEV